jgi:cobalt-zinc-cadmium efflux system membrane fusion protein
MRFAALLALLAGLAGGGFYLFRSQPPEAGRDTALSRSSEPQIETAAEAAAASGEASSADDAIAFARDNWEAAGLRIQPVTQSTLLESIRLTGKVTLNEDRLAHVFPLVEGRVDEVLVRFGQSVRKGDLLVVVQSKEVGQGMLQLFQDRLRLEFAEARNRWVQDVGRNTQEMIARMRASASVDEIEQALKDRPMGEYREKLMSAYVSFLKAQAHMQRLSPLSESGAVPTRQILEAESELNATRATLQSLLEQIAQDTVQEAKLAAQSVRELQTGVAVSETNLRILGFEDADLAEVNPSRQGERLSHYPVTAPFDGTVISKDVVLLEQVAPERQILTIADLSTVWVTADIYETHLPLLSQLSNQTIHLTCDAWPGRRFEARIFYTGDVVQESTRTIALRAIAENPDRLLKPGLFVTVELPGLNTGSVLQVPLSALQDHEGKSFVFVQSGDDSFVRRDVTPGRRNQEAVEILSGLQNGERVVVEGGFALKSRMLAELLAE